MYSFFLIKVYINPKVLEHGRGFLTYWCYVVGCFNSFFACYGERAVGIALGMSENELRFFMRIDNRVSNLEINLHNLKRILINEIFGSLNCENAESEYSDGDAPEDYIYSIERIETRIIRKVTPEYCKRVLYRILARGTDYFKEYFLNSFLETNEREKDGGTGFTKSGSQSLEDAIDCPKVVYENMDRCGESLRYSNNLIKACFKEIREYPGEAGPRSRLAQAYSDNARLNKLMDKPGDSIKSYMKCIETRRKLIDEFPGDKSNYEYLYHELNSMGDIIQESDPRRAFAFYSEALGVLRKLAEDEQGMFFKKRLVKRLKYLSYWLIDHGAISISYDLYKERHLLLIELVNDRNICDSVRELEESQKILDSYSIPDMEPDW